MSEQPSKRVLQAAGQTVAHIWFDTEQTRMMRREERQHLAYHIGRLLTGEGTAAMEWEHFGIELELEADSDQRDEPRDKRDNRDVSALGFHAVAEQDELAELK